MLIVHQFAAACLYFQKPQNVLFIQLVSAKTASAKLESELKQEKGNSQDIRKMLADERNVMSTMDMEHQQQLVELEQRHQEKVLIQYLLFINQFASPFRYIHIY